MTLATLPSFGCHWLLPRLARFQARHPQIAVRLLTSLAVVNLQQEGIDLAIRMGQGDWEGWKAGICLPMNSWWSPPPGYRGGNLPTTPQAIAASDIIFPWSPGMPGAARRGWKSRSSLRPAPERLQSGAGGGSSGGRRGAGAALPGGGGDSPRRAGAAHRRHRPLPLALLANRLPRRRRTGRKSPGSSPGWRRRSPSGASRSALSLRPTAAGPSGRHAPGRDARNRCPAGY
ncbi:LysR substrate-binding domain-containing protein [Klebsiella pneumoniae subsp. pneumoniae]|nr:LysR substrate-binding domain-containing protein [Klebsiella pneumoniae subsp. pneumoniae]